MRLSVEHLTPTRVMLGNGPNVVAIVELLSPDVIIAPKVADRRFIVMPYPGCHFSITTYQERVYRLEVNGHLKAIVQLRSRDAVVCFCNSDVFAIQTL